MHSNTKCRWGILGTASIARKNWHAILNAGNGRLVAVASRFINKADHFIRECQSSAPTCYAVEAVEGYEALIARNDIDALYIPLPTAIRAQWAVKAIEAGKHVVIEKPCGLNADELKEIIRAAERADVQVMDGVMFQHSARIQTLQRLLSSPESLGEVRRINSHFSFMGDQEWIKNHSLVEPAGCLGDVGWYNIRFTLFAMNYAMPVKVRGRMISRSDIGSPVEFEAEMVFGNGVTASIYNAFNTARQQWACISGTRGHVHLDDFVLPHYGNETNFTLHQDSFSGDKCYFNLERHSQSFHIPEYSNNHSTSQEASLFRTFGDIVISGNTDTFWPDVALKTQRIMDAMLLSARTDNAYISLN
ncbi:Gfo/Idh/MocA family protein [Pantoea rwandensis]|uniref:Oxidoreductase n=1 Tax=Pantoea rwandensis TaxID=1076550 RepID=A0A1X1D0U8_9GAMM|nr:Gfo/Idh/MocA family oxidoreductase [Pantoea rwandensis]ORM70308.1 oxidoreductase [Pantoea rwandensis]